MGLALEMVAAQVTAAAAGGSAMAAVAGDSLTIRNTPGHVQLVDNWQDVQTAGFFRIVSPLMHDNQVGLRRRTQTGIMVGQSFPGLAPQHLYSQDTLALTISGAATAGDIESAVLGIWYEDLPGVSGRFIDIDTLQKKGINIYSHELTLAAGTAGGWSGAELITAEFDALKANTDYALLGAQNAVNSTAALGFRAPDWGNLRVAVPGHNNDTYICPAGGSYFAELSRRVGLPTIPVFNSANKSSLFVDCLQDENGADPTLTVVMVELERGAVPISGVKYSVGRGRFAAGCQ